MQSNKRGTTTTITTEGYGPWYVFLLVNVHLSQSSTKKQTEIVLNSNPELYQAIHNRYNSKWGVNVWIILLCMGPFEELKRAKEFHGAWLCKSRGQATRICRGIALAQQTGVRTHYIKNIHDQALNMLRKQSQRNGGGDDNIIATTTNKHKEPNSIISAIIGPKKRTTDGEMIRMHQIQDL